MGGRASKGNGKQVGGGGKSRRKRGERDKEVGVEWVPGGIEGEGGGRRDYFPASAMKKKLLYIIITNVYNHER